jgi:hypothetical protein
LSARRGSLKAIRTNLNDLIKEVYDQALRTKEYIESTENPIFETENGKIAFKLIDKERYRHIYPINVTLESLNHLQTGLNSLKLLNLRKGKEWPWSVFIDDLRTISEIIEFPSEFLVYLQRRIRANDFPQFRTADEIDYLMFFLKEGLYFEDGILKGVDLFVPHGYTEELDRYYHYLAGIVSTGPKPQIQIIEDELIQLINELETIQKQGVTRITTTLMDINQSTQQEILQGLHKFRRLSLVDGQFHNISLIPGDLPIGITFWICPGKKPDFWAVDRFCRLKMYQTHFEEWHVIILQVDNSTMHPSDFKIYNEKWKSDSTMKKRVYENKTRLITDYKKKNKSIGRNQLCPCNSGLKYKKCCGKRIKNLSLNYKE